MWRWNISLSDLCGMDSHSHPELVVDMADEGFPEVWVATSKSSTLIGCLLCQLLKKSSDLRCFFLSKITCILLGHWLVLAMQQTFHLLCNIWLQDTNLWSTSAMGKKGQYTVLKNMFNCQKRSVEVLCLFPEKPSERTLRSFLGNKQNLCLHWD